jgi:hypothetical protein
MGLKICNINLHKVGYLAVKTGLIGALLIGTQGCNDRDLAVGAGAVAIVAGAVAIGAAADSHDHYRHGRPYYGRRHGGHYGYVRPYSSQLQTVQLDAAALGDLSFDVNSTVVVDNTTAAVELADSLRVAEKYDLPLSAAQPLTLALQSAAKGSVDAIRNIGLEATDLELLGRMKMITQQGVERLASALQLPVSEARTLVTRLIQDYKAQAADSRSDYWQACFQSGSWKTPQNNNCQKDFWGGCSPQTGATRCSVR